jgi:hypothetical protein
VFRVSDEPLVPYREGARAELAVDHDQTLVVAHGGPLVLGKADDDGPIVLFGAPTTARKPRTGFHPNLLLFMEQSPDQGLKRKARIE